MDIGQEHKKRIKEIMSGMECPRDFECYKSGFSNLSKANDIGVKTFLKCSEKNPQQCKFSFSFGYEYFCKCPLRVYVAKKLKR